MKLWDGLVDRDSIYLPGPTNASSYLLPANSMDLEARVKARLQEIEW